MPDPIKFSHSQIRDWWNNQAQKNPQSAGMLSVYGADKISQAYRRWAEWRHFRKLVRLKPEMSVLELGCGAGRWAMDMSPIVSKVVGVDFSSEMIRIGCETLQNAGITNVHLEVGSAASFQSSESFDLIYLSGVDQFLDDTELASMLSNVRKLLRPGGILIDRVTLSLSESQFIEKGNGYQCYYRSKHDLIRAMEGAGFYCTYHAPSHQKLELGWLGRNKWCSKQISSLVRRAPNLACPGLHLISKLIRGMASTPKITKARSHDFLVFVELPTSGQDDMK